MTTRPSLRSKLFFAALAVALLALVVAGLMFNAAMRRRTTAAIESTLTAEARLAAELLGHASPAAAGPDALDVEADRIGALLGARVTFIAPDGRVLGDSAEPFAALATLENHRLRPEVAEAAAKGTGRASRFSDTVGTEMLYVAVPVTHDRIGFVRVALPLTDVRDQLRDVLVSTLTALGIALVAAAAIGFALSARLATRVKAIADIAARYRSGDMTPSRLNFGEDELGTVARALDDSIQEIAHRLDELARDRSRMEAILAGMIEGVLVVDPSGRIQLANGAARRMLRLEDVPVGRHYVEVIRHPAITDLLGAALAGRTPDAVQIAPPRDSGRTLMARAAPSTPEGAHGVVLVLHDITDLKRADQIRRDFVANVSHELRTPLTAIRGYVEALSEPDTSPEDSRRFLEVIMRHALRMERLVKDLLRLARLDAGQETLEITSCDARGAIQTVAADLAPSLEARQQRVQIEVDSGAERIQADAAKLHDILRNLIANASTYAPAGSVIAVRAFPSAERTVVAVEDQGPGIPAGDLERIFERFYRVDKSRARDPGGTGIGLAIVKHLAELHGGEVRAENRAEGGARFSLILPGGPRG
ncbi:MAG: ATP-binding protein [Vicinamibacterales bacterium]